MAKQKYSLLLIIVFCIGNAMAQDNFSEIKDAYSNTKFEYSKISGIGHEVGVNRRDTSDVIKVGYTY